MNEVVKAPDTVVPAQFPLASDTLNLSPVVVVPLGPYVQVIVTAVPAAVTAGVPGVYRAVMVLDATFDAVPDFDWTVNVYAVPAVYPVYGKAVAVAVPAVNPAGVGALGILRLTPEAGLAHVTVIVPPFCTVDEIVGGAGGVIDAAVDRMDGMDLFRLIDASTVRVYVVPTTPVNVVDVPPTGTVAIRVGVV